MPITIFNVGLRDDEMEALLGIMHEGGFSTPTAAIRCALWKLANHLDVPMQPDTFEQRIEPMPQLRKRRA
jgi:hypothetical protein